MTVSRALSFWLILVGNLGGLQPQLISNHAANLGCDIWLHLWSLCFFCTNFAFTAAPHGCLYFPFSHFHLHSCWHFFQWWYEIVPYFILVTFCMIFKDSNDTLAMWHISFRELILKMRNWSLASLWFLLQILCRLQGCSTKGLLITGHQSWCVLQIHWEPGHNCICIQ